MNKFSLVTLSLALASMLFLTACSKDGAGRNLLEGRELASDPIPTDGNMPGPNE